MTSIDFNIVEFGAIGDGTTLDTAAIQKAVDSCAEQGGGRVVVPAGTYRSGPIMLKDNIEFHLAAGSLIRGSRNMDDYPCLDFEAQGYHIDFCHASLLTGIGLKNVSITGPGTLDGEGNVWWKARDENRLAHDRPFMIYLCDCEHSKVRDVTLMNSPCWTILPLMCRDLLIDGVTILNPWKPYYNCDGINPHGCRDVRITNCFLDTGDDGITLKCVPEWFVVSKDKDTDYSAKHIPCENILISNCVFEGTRAGIRIYRYPWPGGYVENVRVENIIMRRVGWAFHIASYHDPKEMKDGPGQEDTPVFHNIHFSNITVTQAQIACEARGLAKMPMRDISFSNVNIETDMGFDLRHVDNMLFDNVEIECRGVPLTARDTTNLELRRFNATAPPSSDSAIQLACTKDTWIHGCNAVPGTGVFVGLVGDENRGLVMQDNRLAHAATEQGSVAPANEWNICTHAYSGARWIRDSGSRNTWLPVTPAVMSTIRGQWSEEQVDRIFSISRVEPNARNGAEVESEDEQRRVYIVEAYDVAERLIIFEDGELLRRIDDPDFHAHVWDEM